MTIVFQKLTKTTYERDLQQPLSCNYKKLYDETKKY